MARTEDYENLYYMDEFGEVIPAEDADMAATDDDMDMADGEEIVPDEAPAAETDGSEFHETLRSDVIGDQLEDPALSDEAESDFDDADLTDGIDDEARVKPVADDDLAA